MREWFNEAIFYHIYPLGFCDAPKYNDYTSEPQPRLSKVSEWIDHIKSMEVNAIYFGPIFESVSHGYDTVDYYKVDRRLGDNEVFKDLCSQLHNNGIKVVIDGVFNHVGRDFWAFRDLIQNGQASKYCNWFTNLCFNNTSPYGDKFSYESWNGYYNLVKLNVNNHEVKEHLFGAVKKWIMDFDIDGLRLDCADCLDKEFLKELRIFCKNIKPDFWIMGEVIHGHGDYRYWLNEPVLDSVTNYECYKSLYSSHNEANYFEIAFSLDRQFNEEYGLYRNLHLYSFVDNHDVNRIASILKDDRYLYTIYSILFTMPGIPSIYYGSEWGIKGQKVNGSDDELRPSLDLDTISKTSENIDLKVYISKLAHIHNRSEALKYGRYKQLLVRNEQYIFSRFIDEEYIIVILNSSKQEFSVSIDIPFGGSKLVDLLNEGESFNIQNGKSNIECSYPRQARIMKVQK